jgi:aspartate beta-hydroxylase
MDTMEYLRKQYEALICDLLGEGLTGPGYQIADIAVAQGLWTERMHRPIEFHAAAKEMPFFDPGDFWFTEHLAANWELIRAEIDRIEDPAAAGFSTAGLDGSSVQGGQWRQLMLWDRGRRFDRACDVVPVTAEILSAIPEVTDFGNGFVMLSWLQPGTWIKPHCGATNSKARTHFCIRTDEKAWMRVGTETRGWTEGESFVFDDSYEHEVRHEGDRPRVVLLLDTPNPHLLERDAVRDRDQSTWTDEIEVFMSSMRLERIVKDGARVTAQFDGATEEFVRSYMDTRDIGAVEYRRGAVSTTPAGPAR